MRRKLDIRWELRNIRSDTYKGCGYSKDRLESIHFVNRVDELLELRGFEFLGESDFTKTDSESKYRGILFNISKDIREIHIFGKVMHTLRMSGHKETRSSRRTRDTMHLQLYRKIP